LRSEDVARVGALIARTYAAFNLESVPPSERQSMLGPYVHVASDDAGHRAAIASAVRAPIVFVAEDGDAIVGVLRGGRLVRPTRAVLQSLFVDRDHQGRGIGRLLVAEFEAWCRGRGIDEVKVASAVEAVEFYTRLGYRRTTGVRPLSSFGDHRIPYQPMLKRLTVD
jgi:GNAT superfamily N-acetyltransferase